MAVHRQKPCWHRDGAARRRSISGFRLDGKVKTDMPDADIGFATLETKTHGNVLWVVLNRMRTGSGFSLMPALQEKYKDGITQEQVIAEAAEAMKPFKVEIERLDW